MKYKKLKKNLRILLSTVKTMNAIIQRENAIATDLTAAQHRAGLGALLQSQNKTRWLDIGSGPQPEANFFSVDIFPEHEINQPGTYFQCNIIEPEPGQMEALGKFDLIRMQHVFEHFSAEDGLRVLENCAKLLSPGGYLLMTTPDLRKFVTALNENRVSSLNEDFTGWAHKRIAAGSPESFYFSIFTHSLPSQPHFWCYDYEGLEFQVKKTGLFTNICELTLRDELANIPFTHNRPKEDVCLLAQRA